MPFSFCLSCCPSRCCLSRCCLSRCLSLVAFFTFSSYSFGSSCYSSRSSSYSLNLPPSYSLSFSPLRYSLSLGASGSLCLLLSLRSFSFGSSCYSSHSSSYSQASDSPCLSLLFSPLLITLSLSRWLASLDVASLVASLGASLGASALVASLSESKSYRVGCSCHCSHGSSYSISPPFSLCLSCSPPPTSVSRCLSHCAPLSL